MIRSPKEHVTFFPTPASEFLKKKLPPKEPIIAGLLHHRDMVALGARRRHGKTTLVTDLAITLAEGKPDFLGYKVVKPARTLLLLIEDDPSELQERFAKHLGKNKEVDDRILVVTREDFMEAGVKVDIADHDFQRLLEIWADNQKPDVIVLDNLSFLIGAQFNDSERMHQVVTFLYKLASKYNAALIVAAHPRKDSANVKKNDRVTLENDPDRWFEGLMGSSHFVNGMPCLWGLERDRAADTLLFVAGRQRVDGTQMTMNLSYEKGRLSLVSDYAVNYSRIINTPKREAAWKALPERPTTFGRNEAEKFITPHMKSASSRHEWLTELRRLKLLVDTPDAKLMKALDGAAKELHEMMAEAMPGEWIDSLPEELKPEKYKEGAAVLPFKPKEDVA